MVPILLWGGDRYRNKDTCNDDERDVVIRPASVPWLVNNMMVVVNCCVGGHCYFFPRQGMMATFLIEQIINFFASCKQLFVCGGF